MKQTINLVFADDSQLLLDALPHLLEDQDEIVMAGRATNGQELVDLVSSIRPDVVITDIDMPVMNGIDATKEIKKRFPETAVLALSMWEEERMIMKMLDAGADGYILKTASAAELLQATKAVSQGETYLCNGTSMRLSKMIANSALKPFSDEKKIELSPREVEIIVMICEQLATKEIADETKLSLKTIEKYRTTIMEKTGARNMVGIVVYAIREGLYKP
jgi:DNA-binding NarL/FixJ family response regulator